MLGYLLLFAPLTAGAAVVVGGGENGHLAARTRSTATDCPGYSSYAFTQHEPLSEGKYKLGYMRPEPQCRTASFPEVESKIVGMKQYITDPDLYRVFENSFPNTLDTTISWKGVAADNQHEELTFIVTGDINAMWLRDSANQLHSYASLLRRNSSTSSFASLWRGAINLQGRYIRLAPFCNAFQPPPEANLGVTRNDWAAADNVSPFYDRAVAFECKYELDSLAAFLQLSYDYYTKTNDRAFFGMYGWVETVALILDTAERLRAGTYGPDGRFLTTPYAFERSTTSASETVNNHGTGEPIRERTGMVRSWFRPSDDACTYQLFVPANAMFAHYLRKCATVMGDYNSTLYAKMNSMATEIEEGIQQYGVYNHSEFGKIYAYEVDGYGSYNAMDDANLPSLLSLPLLSESNYTAHDDETYANTRRFVLSKSNPYYMHGPVINATGGPHVGPGNAWPMGLIVQVMTSNDDDEIRSGLKQLLRSTDGLGLMHETISSHDAKRWTRQWFSWANGLFGQMILQLHDERPHLLKEYFQDD